MRRANLSFGRSGLLRSKKMLEIFLLLLLGGLALLVSVLIAIYILKD